MFPSLSGYDAHDAGLADAELSRQRAHAAPGGLMKANEANVVLAELREGKCLTSRASFGMIQCPVLSPRRPSASTLEAHVSEVVRIGSEKQVIGTDTQPHVAAMADAKAGHGSTGEKPRDPMGGEGLCTDSEAAIAIRALRRSPKPACSGLLNLRPEPFGDRLLGSHWAPPVPVVRDGLGSAIPSRPVHFSTQPC